MGCVVAVVMVQRRVGTAGVQRQQRVRIGKLAAGTKIDRQNTQQVADAVAR